MEKKKNIKNIQKSNSGQVTLVEVDIHSVGDPNFVV